MIKSEVGQKLIQLNEASEKLSFSCFCNVSITVGPVSTTTTTAPPILEYPLGLPILAIFMLVVYGLIRRKTKHGT